MSVQGTSSTSSEMSYGHPHFQCVEDVVILSPIEFIEDSEQGLGIWLYPVERIIIKAIYGIPLDDKATFKNQRWNGKSFEEITEDEYLRRVHAQGRCNISEVREGEEKTEVYLALGRRSGSTFIASLITAYETYKLLKKVSPHKYYGIPESGEISLLNISDTKENCKLNKLSFEAHVDSCDLLLKCGKYGSGNIFKFRNPNDLENENGATKVRFKYSSEKGFRGYSNILVVIDNAAEIKESNHTNSLDNVYAAVNPSRAAFSPKDPQSPCVTVGPCEARMVMLSTPGEKSGLFYDKFQKALDGACKQSFCLQAPTWEVNPSINHDMFIECHEKDLPEFWNMYGAQFKDRVSKVDELMSEIVKTSEHLLALQIQLQNEIGKKN